MLTQWVLLAYANWGHLSNAPVSVHAAGVYYFHQDWHYLHCLDISMGGPVPDCGASSLLAMVVRLSIGSGLLVMSLRLCREK